MAAALRGLGIGISDANPDHWEVSGCTFLSTDADIDVGNAGTVLRFVPPLAALARGATRFDGDEAVRRRPIAPLISALRSLGVDVDDGGRGAPPFVVNGTGSARGGRVAVDASASSQLISALLLAGPSYGAGVEVRHIGERPVPNAPHLAMTVAMLARRGAEVEVGDDLWRVAPGRLRPLTERIEPDLSSAAPFLAAAAVTAGRVTIADWPAQSTQPGALLPELLRPFGVMSRHDGRNLVVVGPSRLSGADIDLRRAGELTPVLAAVAALADSPSRLTGIDYLRGHETDRLAALAAQISALGGEVQELPDGLSISPRRLHGGDFATYDDHRMAMAGAVLGLVVPGVVLEDVAATSKTFPDFAELWSRAVEGTEVLH
jgi:3-phosphoshikimate 1-carboxyvinyltransferase